VTSERAEHHGVLGDVCNHAAQLISAANARLLRLTVRAGDVVVELEWPPPTTRTAESPRSLAAAAEPEPGAATEFESLHYIRAEMVGTFYRATEPGAKPFVSVGDAVQTGQQVAILEVMKLMTPIAADRAGRVVDVLVGDGSPVEYGASLIALDTSGAGSPSPG
jgi:acetyl-CoA carboxylase biotin carboxyl carrier protein